MLRRKDLLVRVRGDQDRYLGQRWNHAQVTCGIGKGYFVASDEFRSRDGRAGFEQMGKERRRSCRVLVQGSSQSSSMLCLRLLHLL